MAEWAIGLLYPTFTPKPEWLESVFDMANDAPAKPMPTTGMPDRESATASPLGPPLRPDTGGPRSTLSDMKINPGRK